MSLVLGIDLGTSGCRSAAFDSGLNMLESVRAEYPLTVLGDQEVEQDAEMWWNSVKETVRGVTAKLGARSAEIKSVAVSSQGISVVPVGKDGKPLCRAISWLDGRAVGETAELLARYGAEEIFRRTGKRISSLYTLPKLLWIKKNRPEIYRQTYKFLLPLDFIQFRLCGNYVTDHTMAAGTMMYDIHEQKWMDGLLGENGIGADLLPEIAWAGSAAGKILPGAARELGLGENVLVATGAQDQKCAACGGGASERVMTVSLGTGSCITKLSERPALDQKMRIPVFSYMEPGRYDMEGVINTAGSALGWFREKFVPTKSFEELSQTAASAEAGALKFYPYLSGGSSPHWGEGLGAFTGLSLKSGPAECVRALMEGVAYHIRANTDVMDQMGRAADTLHVFGGGSKSGLWCELIANITNKRVARLESCETALAGAAKLAFRGIGEEAGELAEEREFLPRPDEVQKYKERYIDYETTRKCCFGNTETE